MKVGVIGAGKIGNTIAAYLKNDFEVSLVDKNNKHFSHNFPVRKLDVNNIDSLNSFVNKNDIIVSAAPFQATKKIANVCSGFADQKAYFDLTEDVETTEYIKTLNGHFMMPQCGLAPGAINIIANHLIKQFMKVVNVNIRVGALPLYPSTAMAYNFTWSVDGLLNTYINFCDALIDGKKEKLFPLDGLETLYIDGTKYEAFNTSGGVGTLCETYSGKIQNLNYKTIRYPNHHKAIKVIFSDLDLKNNKDTFKTIFNKTVPYTTDDVVIILVKVQGYKNDDNYVEQNYFKKIYGDGTFSAIQRATASGICSNIVSYASSKIPLTHNGFIKQEDIGFDIFTNNKFGKIFL
jgi:saccharopine dehydrogenase-like NADP-dependent oxidoreductase